MIDTIPLNLAHGIPGQRDARTAELVRGTGNVMSFRVGPWSLPVIVPWDINPDFGYQFDAADTVGLGSPLDWSILCVVQLPKPGRDNGTVNQFAPIVINNRTSAAAQIINMASGYSTRDPFRLLRPVS